jgi:acetate kinase
LGSGCSAAAVFERESQDTSMGMTPLEGLVMATRSGDIDPGAVLALQRIHGLDVAAVDRLLNQESGLLGMSGSRMSMHDFVHHGEDPAISAAMDLFAYRAAKTIASYGVPLAGIEQIVFSGGVGEHAPELRRRILGLLGWLGVSYDPQSNASNQQRLSAAGSEVDVRIVPVDESRQLARILGDLMG